MVFFFTLISLKEWLWPDWTVGVVIETPPRARWILPRCRKVAFHWVLLAFCFSLTVLMTCSRLLENLAEPEVTTDQCSVMNTTSTFYHV